MAGLTSEDSHPHSRDYGHLHLEPSSHQQQKEEQQEQDQQNTIHHHPTDRASTYNLEPRPSYPRSHAPSHSIAGPPDATSNDVYIDPEYQKHNPRYMKNQEEPIWGLAKPLPRVVRSGTKRDGSQNHEMYQPESKGESEAVPAMDQTPNLGDDHWMEEGEEHKTRYTEDERKDEGENLNRWSKVRMRFRAPLAEWLATTVAMLIGLCGTLSIGTGGTAAGGRICLYWSWGFGIMVGIYLAGGVSGAHLNPAISIALWIFRGFPSKQCAYYIVAQLLGALTAGGLAYCIYRDSIINLAPGVSLGATGLGFYTEPLAFVRNVTAFFNEFVSAAMLLCTIFAMGDNSNAPPGAGMHSFIIGLIIFVLDIGFSYNTGGCFNPARDLGPRLVALMAGYGGEIFKERNGWWFWGSWLATISGALAGAAMYDICIFIGGESPVNFPRHRKKSKKGDLENGKDVES